MFRHIIVGIDAETRGVDALALARTLAGGGSSLTLAHVHAGFPVAAKGAAGEFEAIERERALQMLAEVDADGALGASLRTTGATTIGHGLHRLAELERADLLVVGSTRHGPAGRVLLGDATREALAGAPCAVAIAPVGYAADPSPIHTIGVAYDGSEQSANALAVARRLAAETGAKLSGFQAVLVPSYSLAGGYVPPDTWSQEWVDEARRRIEDLGGIEGHAAFGDPARELARFSGSVDLLVAGARDYGPLGRLFHGSTTRRLAGRSQAPLLVLTRGARARDAAGTEATPADAVHEVAEVHR